MDKKKAQSRKPNRASRQVKHIEKVAKTASSKEIEQRAKKLLGIQGIQAWMGGSDSLTGRGRDTLVMQPTGSGKSAIYQLAGASKEGSTVIISPLIALQKDQVEIIAASKLGRSRPEELHSFCRWEYLLRYFGDEYSGPCGD